MKKLMCLALALILIVAVTACSKNDTPDSQVDDNPKDTVTEPENPKEQVPNVQPPSPDEEKLEDSNLPSEDELSLIHI